MCLSGGQLAPNQFKRTLEFVSIPIIQWTMCAYFFINIYFICENVSEPYLNRFDGRV
ncbi:hypothetical protein P152DRAFT_881 [Eremomyces bilateralis CBS 781.70]|uniref:Uncharacterized protein n=1 Tax=Eremomyces bilateralis CBS 781.70 TaxID=1392243 RepID=A0A6G1GG16_9PEZI|nr:uncharacterized protein P152DRAFT_881 [Eremomyces bilateralis CBS 781.70]KAF1816800.1 hypothetical protein P152DRAFT_881 [Eremomyces bilateralis CBS 781.70]